ncbi:uncharacterized protein LOC143941090 [Lithobates pipiens]
MSVVTNEDSSASENGYTNKIYEIIVVSIASAIILVCGLVYLIMVARRRWKICGNSYDQHTEENTVPSVEVSQKAQDKISTIDLQGPAHITYINERAKAASEMPIGEVKLSRDALLYISLITCLNLPDDMQSEESL